MNKFLESIRCQNKQLYKLSYHQARVDKTFSTFFPDCLSFQLSNLEIPEHIGLGLYKCRILYSDSTFQVEYTPYQIRKIHTLKLIFDNHIDYTFKLENRNHINKLFKKRDKADDILIIKNQHVTDSSYANIAFWDGLQWFTPTLPLLAGTMRQYLLDMGIIYHKPIHYTDIQNFHSFKLFNAMIPFGLAPVISTNQIFF